MEIQLYTSTCNTLQHERHTGYDEWVFISEETYNIYVKDTQENKGL